MKPLAKLTATDMEDDALKRFKQLVIVKHGILKYHVDKKLTKAMGL
jgi:hypothetical protein